VPQGSGYAATLGWATKPRWGSPGDRLRKPCPAPCGRARDTLCAPPGKRGRTARDFASRQPQTTLRSVTQTTRGTNCRAGAAWQLRASRPMVLRNCFPLWCKLPRITLQGRFAQSVSRALCGKQSTAKRFNSLAQGRVRAHPGLASGRPPAPRTGATHVAPHRGAAGPTPRIPGC
jgi:hypothetical protein